MPAPARGSVIQRNLTAGDVAVHRRQIFNVVYVNSTYVNFENPGLAQARWRRGQNLDFTILPGEPGRHREGKELAGQRVGCRPDTMLVLPSRRMIRLSNNLLK
jgi:hypothetical protein